MLLQPGKSLGDHGGSVVFEGMTGTRNGNPVLGSGSRGVSGDAIGKWHDVVFLAMKEKPRLEDVCGSGEGVAN